MSGLRIRLNSFSTRYDAGELHWDGVHDLCVLVGQANQREQPSYSMRYANAFCAENVSCVTVEDNKEVIELSLAST